MRQTKLSRFHIGCSVFLLALTTLPLAADPDAVQQCVSSQQPSFDCSNATSDIERELCRNPDAALSDCLLGRIFRDARLAAATEEARRQLLNEQRSWLRQRDETCSRELSTIQSCLIAQSERRSIQLISSFGLNGNDYGLSTSEADTSSSGNREDAAIPAPTASPEEESVPAPDTQPFPETAVSTVPNADLSEPYPNADITQQEQQQTDTNAKTISYALWYFFIAGFFGLPLVRPYLMYWYRSQTWFFSGTGPVDILFRQIAARLSFELFVFGVACVVGGLGGWIYVILRAFRAKAAVNPNGEQSSLDNDLGVNRPNSPPSPSTDLNAEQSSTEAAKQNVSRSSFASATPPREPHQNVRMDSTNRTSAEPFSSKSLSIEDLPKLARLRDEGILTDTEFNLLKNRVLGIAQD